MCGIAGIITTDKKANSFDIEIHKMADIMKHRGPDGDGFFIDENVALGHRRLAIIDVSDAGHQPMSDKDEKMWIVFNGEIYNYQEIKARLIGKYKFKTHTDTEVIIFAYKEWGKECLNLFRGMFAFAIYDKEKEEVFIARDHFGQKPLYYYYDNKNFYFASSIRSITSVLEKQALKINYNALHLYFLHNYRHIPDPHSIFQNIYKLPPAHSLTFSIKTGEYKLEEYWKPDFSKNYNKDYINQYKNLLKECVDLTKISDVPVGLLLSGGIDSSSIASVLEDKQLNSFALGCSKEDSELKRARIVANLFKTKHNEFVLEGVDFEKIELMIDFLGEPINLLSAVFSEFIAEKAKEKGIKVLIGGNGADEIFYGYDGSNRLLVISYILKFLHVSEEKVNNIKSDYYIKKGEKIKKAIYNKRFIDLLSGFNEGEIINKYFNEANSNLYIEKSYYAGLMSENQHSVTIIGDLTGMMNSVEIRTPFLDPKMFEFAAKLPIYKKVASLVDKTKNKYIMKVAMNKILPYEILWAKKMGFGYNFNLGELIRNQWREKSHYYIFDVVLKESGLFEYDAIEKIWNEHIAGKNHSSTLWGIITFGIWYKKFISI